MRGALQRHRLASVWATQIRSFQRRSVIRAFAARALLENDKRRITAVMANIKSLIVDIGDNLRLPRNHGIERGRPSGRNST